MRAEADGCNSIKYNLTSDTISSIFRCYPAGKLSVSACSYSVTIVLYFIVKKKHAQMVPDKVQTQVYCGWTLGTRKGPVFILSTLWFRCPRVTFG